MFNVKLTYPFSLFRSHKSRSFLPPFSLVYADSIKALIQIKSNLAYFECVVLERTSSCSFPFLFSIAICCCHILLRLKPIEQTFEDYLLETKILSSYKSEFHTNPNPKIEKRRNKYWSVNILPVEQWMGGGGGRETQKKMKQFSPLTFSSCFFLLISKCCSVFVCSLFFTRVVYMMRS